MKLADQIQREAAIDIGRSLAVAAPAGSGKTSLLVQRFLLLLAQAQRPEEILAITFTRKAANEMRARIVEALQQAQEEMPGEVPEFALKQRQMAQAALARDREMGWNLLQNPARLRLQTFDSLCGYLARRLALDTGQSIPAEPLDRAKPLYLEAAQRLLARIEEDGPAGDAVRTLTQHFDGDQKALQEQLANLLESRAYWLELLFDPRFGADQLRENVRNLVESEIERLQKVLLATGLLPEIQRLYRYSADNLGIELALRDCDFGSADAIDADWLPAWRCLSNLLLKKDSKWRKQVTERDGFPANNQLMKSDMTALLADLDDRPLLLAALLPMQILPLVPASGDANDRSLQALALVLVYLATELQVLFQERNCSDHSGISISALAALGTPDNPTALNLRLDYRIRHLLVDEFQDTSKLQIGLLERLTAGWQPGDGRTLFVVGDAMQSIYEFRRADVNLFVRAREKGIGDLHLEAIDLATNFRSRAGIVDWINRYFPSIFALRDDRLRGEVCYRPSVAHDRNSGEAEIQLRGFTTIAEEAQWLAQDVAKRLANSAENESIAILVRARSHLKEILPALRAQGIRWRARDVDRLAKRMHVRDLHSLVRALHSPADRIAWLSLLRSPMVALDLQDLWLIAGDGDHPSAADGDIIWRRLRDCEESEGLSVEGLAIAQRVRPILQQMLQGFGRIELRALVADGWEQLGGWLSLFNPADQLDIEDYLALLDTHARGGYLPDLDIFEDALDQLYARPSGDPSVRVEIMSIFAAKGLEFHYLYLPALNRGTKSSNKPALEWVDQELESGESHFLAALLPARGGADELYDYLHAQAATRRKIELCRLLYVAATRAIKGLCLTGTLTENKKSGEYNRPPKDSLLSLIWENLGAEFIQSMPADGAAEVEPAAREISIIRRIRPHLLQTPPSPTANLPVPPSPLPPVRANLVQRLAGDLLHQALMQRVVQRLDDMGSALEADWRRELRLAGLPAADLDLALERMNKAYSWATSTELGRWILDPTHADSACELPIEVMQPDGSLRRSVIDRTFIAGGERWIVDYKSALPSSNQNAEQFLAEQEDKYRSQMARYRNIFLVEGLPVRTLLLFPSAQLSLQMHFD